MWKSSVVVLGEISVQGLACLGRNNTSWSHIWGPALTVYLLLFGETG